MTASTHRGLLFGVLAISLAIASVLPARAQGIGNNPQVNPGAIQNQQQRLQQQLQQQQTPILVPQTSPVTGPERTAPELRPGGPAFQLTAVTFDKSAFLTPGELNAIVKPYIGHQVTFETLQTIVQAINGLYDKKGIITASATLPPQQVAGGTVHIGLVEGKLGKVNLSGQSQTKTDYMLNRLRLTPGQVVDVPGLQSDVESFNRLNDTQINALLQPGANFGQTDVNLAVREPPLFSGEFFGDNEGVDTTNRNEIGLFMRGNGPLGVNDRATVYGTYSQGSLAGSVAYNLPIGLWGDRVGISYQRNRIAVVLGPFRSLGISGTSQVGEMDLTHPFIANQRWLVTANVTGSDTFSKTDQSGVFVSDDQTRKAGGGVSITNNGPRYSISFTQNYARAHTRDDILSMGRYLHLLDGTFTAYSKLFWDLSVNLVTAWQYSPQKLLPGDQLFEIGGPTTVRGFQANTFAGDNGYYGNLELHDDLLPLTNRYLQLGDKLSAFDGFLFADRGSVYSTSPSQRTLESVGFGLSGTIENHLIADTSVGFPLLHGVPRNPGYVIYSRVGVRLP